MTEERNTRVLKSTLSTILSEAKEPIIKAMAKSALDETDEVQPHPTFCNQIKQGQKMDLLREAGLSDQAVEKWKGLDDAIQKAQKFDELKKAYDEFYAGSKKENDLMAILDRIMQ